MRMKQIKIFNKFMALMGKRIWIYTAAIIGMIAFDAGFSIVTSNFINRLTERIQTKDVTGLGLDIAINVAIGVVVLLGWRYSTIRYNIEAKRATACVQCHNYSKALKLPQKYYDEHHTGEFISKLVYDTNKATDIYRATLRRLIAPVITVLIYMVYMLVMCWQMTVILVFFNCIMLFYNTFFAKKIHSISLQMSNGNKSITENLMNLIQGVSILKMYGGGKKVSDFVEANKDFTESQLRNSRMRSVASGINGLSEIVTSLVFLAVGVIFVSRSWARIGEIVAIYVLYGSFAWNFKQIDKYIPEFLNKLVYVQNIMNFLEYEEEKTYFEKIKGENEVQINVKDVTFGYNSDTLIFEKICLSVEKGEKVALIAESGRGKSTLIKLLLGMYEPFEGSISIAGKNFCDDGVCEVRNQIAYVPQEAYLFNVSIKENIAYGNPKASEEEIMEAAKCACAHDFIMKLEKGYDTPIGEVGSTLSGGERQRIAIARALIKKAPVIIFDEATSALDNITEENLYKKVLSEYSNTTMLIIAHRTSTILLSDRVVSL